MRWLALAALAFVLSDWIQAIPLKVFVCVLGSVVFIGYVFLIWLAHVVAQADANLDDRS